jgi:hypothetical protein
MRNLTSPQAILLGLIAFAIASIPYSSNLVTPAQASVVQKVEICDPINSSYCARVNIFGEVRVDTKKKAL